MDNGRGKKGARDFSAKPMTGEASVTSAAEGEEKKASIT